MSDSEKKKKEQESDGSRGGAGGGGPGSPLFLDQTEARRAEKEFFELFGDRPHPATFSKGLDDWPHSVISRSVSGTARKRTIFPP